jgi:prephenate dehydrogenase
MSTSKPVVTIVGLGLIGGSIGLALRQAGVASTIVGHDKEHSVANQAKKMGAVDRTEWNLITACEGSDLIILATPLEAIAATIKAIAPYLKAGCVVLDTAPIKEPVLAWAAEILPKTVGFVGGNPIIGASATGSSGLEAARADLFEKCLFCLVPAPDADEHAVQMAANLATLLGAKPMFYDPVEHDSLLTAVNQLPAIVALTLLEMAVNQPAWRDLRKVAGAPFETATRLAAADLSVYSDLAAANRDNLVRWIDSFSAALATVRQALVEDEPQDLVEQFEDAVNERNRWLHDRATGNWEEGPREAMPERPNMMDTFLGSFWRRGDRKKGE